jgi:hypothetical protein
MKFKDLLNTKDFKNGDTVKHEDYLNETFTITKSHPEFQRCRIHGKDGKLKNVGFYKLTKI